MNETLKGQITLQGKLGTNSENTMQKIYYIGTSIMVLKYVVGLTNLEGEKGSRRNYLERNTPEEKIL